MTKLNEFIEYINKNSYYKIGDVIEYIDGFIEYGNTLRLYNSYLLKCGFIKKYGNGWYECFYYLPEDLTLKDLKLFKKYGNDPIFILRKINIKRILEYDRI